MRLARTCKGEQVLGENVSGTLVEASPLKQWISDEQRAVTSTYLDFRKTKARGVEETADQANGGKPRKRLGSARTNLTCWTTQRQTVWTVRGRILPKEGGTGNNVVVSVPQGFGQEV